MSAAVSSEARRSPIAATTARRGRSLFWVIAGAFLLISLLGTVAQSLLAMAVLRPLETRDQRSRAELFASRFETEIARQGSPDTRAIHALMPRLRQESGLRFISILYRDHQGQIIADPPTRASEIAAGYQEALTPGKRLAERPGDRPRYEIVARRSLTKDGAPLGEIVVLRFARNRPVWDWFFSSRALLLSAPVAILMSLVVALVFVRLLVRRLRALETLATRVAEGDLSVRVEDKSGDEIGRLAERLNRMTESLAEARDHLERQEAQRRQLFADITHELATPLTSIRGYTETLLDPGVSVSAEETVRYHQHMLAESRRLERLIRDLFDLARLEAGATPLEIEKLDWVALCRNTIERFEPRFRAAGLRLVWRDAEAEAWIEADGHRMEQVLENLLVNALRYVPSGGSVELSIQRVAGPDGERFRMTIDDDGPGLAPEEIPMLFERFYRAPAARGSTSTHQPGGSGLGLAIVREIVQRHGGAVSAAPRAPRGLSIRVELPATRQAPRLAA